MWATCCTSRETFQFLVIRIGLLDYVIYRHRVSIGLLEVKDLCQQVVRIFNAAVTFTQNVYREYRQKKEICQQIREGAFFLSNSNIA